MAFKLAYSEINNPSLFNKFLLNKSCFDGAKNKPRSRSNFAEIVFATNPPKFGMITQEWRNNKELTRSSILCIIQSYKRLMKLL